MSIVHPSATRHRIVKHTPGGVPHDQNEHGRWSRGVSANQISERTEEQGGSTQRLATGVQPDRGFAVGISEFSSGAIPNPTIRDFQDYMRVNAAELAKPGRHLGTWYDTDTGDVWLDVVEVFDGDDYVSAFDQAVNFAFHDNSELAIFDLHNGPLNNFEDIRPEQVADYRQRLSPDGGLAVRVSA